MERRGGGGRVDTREKYLKTKLSFISLKMQSVSPGTTTQIKVKN